ncbi:MAG: flagellar biosynthetic protein FliR [Solirubrobacteraceae bacterium]
MTAAQVNQLLSSISTQHVYAFFLVLARVAPLFVLAPVFSSQMLIPQARMVIALGLALGLTPLAQHGQDIPAGVLPLAVMVVQNAVVGLALAYALATVFAAVQSAGTFADAFGGFSFGSMIDPVNGNPGGSMTNLYTMVGLAMFLVIGGDAWTVRGLNGTFTVVPLTGAPAIRSMVGYVESAFTSMLVSAVEIVAPVILAVLVTDVAFGMLSKVVPQLSVFSVGFVVRIGVTLLIVSVSLPFIGNWMSNALYSTVGTAVQTVGIR